MGGTDTDIYRKMAAAVNMAVKVEDGEDLHEIPKSEEQAQNDSCKY